MKKTIFIILFMMLIPHQTMIEADKELDDIVNTFTDQGFLLDEWQVVIVNKLTKKEFENIAKKLQISYVASVRNEENTVKYEFEAKNSEEPLNHSIRAILPKNNSNDISVQLVIFGEEWNETVQNYYNHLTRKLYNEFSLTFTKIFTCVKLSDNGIINDGFSHDELWEKMNVVHKKEQFDTIQDASYLYEMYGYNPSWKTKMIIQEDPINFHFVMKNDDQNKKQVIIGTPIILNEY